ncbi:Pimeloyl-ACP methyl ester carboxylesterase [Noviherbaspirillum humi]|uniref:Pimeloyl-ACP methyl ester carboxylesterase n=1 Tax=Noviherbaspirillum humi TaxID=1688639 RepID=A0A239I682_9BURK|nr:alpha/beta hydrolase [Noviherbaspirillum humi]SNS88991.1 Pimeloyl-ACP methyl ester carboxylesterase [Noviherbaspirillum humi]
MNDQAMSPSLQQQVELLDAAFPERRVETADGMLSCRSCGQGDAIVLLHGIGSGAASWLPCALQLRDKARVVAWNAPGYGASDPLLQARPQAKDYAVRLDALLAALDIERCTLVGHSLGAIMAAAYVAGGGRRVAKLALLSPAQGYGVDPEKAKKVETERLGNLAQLGIEGMAQRSPQRMLSADADETARQWVTWNSRQLRPAGYAQAVHLLCGADIRADAPQGVPCVVACGDADAVTTPEASRALADHFGVPYMSIAGAGHACYIEQPRTVAELILSLHAAPIQHEQA